MQFTETEREAIDSMTNNISMLLLTLKQKAGLLLSDEEDPHEDVVTALGEVADSLVEAHQRLALLYRPDLKKTDDKLRKVQVWNSEITYELRTGLVSLNVLLSRLKRLTQ
jgi:hypothetical protein